MQKLQGDVQGPVFSMNIADQSDSSYGFVDLVTCGWRDCRIVPAIPARSAARDAQSSR
jgi:hypothetical protein